MTRSCSILVTFLLLSAQCSLNNDPGFHLSCDEHLSKGWGPPLG